MDVLKGGTSVPPLIRHSRSEITVRKGKITVFALLRTFDLMLQAGIVGLPNVGKSTLFNALTAQEAALAANYPFATIEPNVGVVAVPDERLAVLEQIHK